MNADRNRGVACVTAAGEHGALAYVDGDLDSCEPTQLAALESVEKKLVEALVDVRELITLIKLGM